MKKSTVILLVIVGILIVGAACFGGSFLGVKYFNDENKNENVLKDESKEEKDTEETKEESSSVVETKEYKDFSKKDTCPLSNDICTYNYTFEKQDNYISEVKVDDLFTYAHGIDFGSFIYILKDGDVYYSRNFIGDTEVLPGIVKYDFSDSYSPEWKKVDLGKKVKRIKGINAGTDVSPDVMFITEDGKVYLYGNNPVLLDDISDYEVDDVLEFDNGVMMTYKVVLKDGTILNKTILSE